MKPEDKKDALKDNQYDGIQEYNNPLPRWWLLTFYGTIVFSVGYWLYDQTFHAAPTSHEKVALIQKQQEEKAAKHAEGMTEEHLIALSKDSQVVARGKEIFAQNCMVCHGAEGGGGIGPNLTDDYFIHGFKAMDTYKVVSDGVLDKGMAAWKSVLGPSKVQDVVAFVLTIQHTNVKGGKAPQGELHKP